MNLNSSYKTSNQPIHQCNITNSRVLPFNPFVIPQTGIKLDNKNALITIAFRLYSWIINYIITKVFYAISRTLTVRESILKGCKLRYGHLRVYRMYLGCFESGSKKNSNPSYSYAAYISRTHTKALHILSDRKMQINIRPYFCHKWMSDVCSCG